MHALYDEFTTSVTEKVRWSHEKILGKWVATDPVAEFSVSISSTPKFICSSYDGVPRLLITQNYISYKKVTFTKTG